MDHAGEAITNAQLVMLALQGLFTLAIMFMGLMLRGMTANMSAMSVGIAAVANDLKQLNSLVLGEYAKREDLHKLREDMQGAVGRVDVRIVEVSVRVGKLEGAQR